MTVTVTPQAVTWQFLGFDELTTSQLYRILQLRSEVFVVEQACLFQDMDDLDSAALHLLGFNQGALMAYARCFAPGDKYVESSIGRVITRADNRNTGLGHVLMRCAMANMQQRWGAQPIRISAQARLQNFYRQHGFVSTGLPYIEDGIDHIEMVRPAAVGQAPSNPSFQTPQGANA
jgi:ElaA protein